MHIVLVFFFPFGWVLLGIQGIDKGFKKCVTLGSLNTFWGYTSFGMGSSVLHVGVSIRSWIRFILYMSLVFQSNTSEHLKCVV